MKYILILTVLFSQYAHGEQIVELDFSYKSSSVYIIEQETMNVMKINYSGDLNDAPDRIRAKLPMDLKVKQEMLQSVKTGSKSSEGTYPVSIIVESRKTYVSVDDSKYVEQTSDFNNRLVGVTINGFVHPNGKMEYKSASGKGASNEIKKMMRSIFDQVSSSNVMAGSKIKVGETVPLKLPMSVPVGDSRVVQFDMGMFYTLDKVINDIAHFNVRYSAVVNSELNDELNISVKGQGKGVMVYDVIKKIAPLTKADITIDMKVPLNDGFLDVSSKSYSNIRTRVENQ